MRLSQNGITAIIDSTPLSRKVLLVDNETDETSVSYDSLLVRFLMGTPDKDAVKGEGQ
jgi:hypothetical protein